MDMYHAIMSLLYGSLTQVLAMVLRCVLVHEAGWPEWIPALISTAVFLLASLLIVPIWPHGVVLTALMTTMYLGYVFLMRKTIEAD